LSAKRLTKKLIKIFSILLATLVVLLTAFHFWFVSHAKGLLENLVASKSSGKLKLEAADFKFNWFSRKMQLDDAVFFTTDTISATTSYRFAVKKIKFKVRTVLPMIFERRILINLIHLEDPDILVTKINPAIKDSLKKAEDLSIPHEMGEIYKSIQDALQVLKVKKFEIENARFTLHNRLKPEEVPLIISHIDFHIDNFKVDEDDITGREKILFSDNVVLKSRDQQIIFPNGRHSLGFRNFRINIEKRIVEFDSCTIAALKTDSSSAGFSIFFDTLQLSKIDFDTLYHTEVIKADSVYCVNPEFRLAVDLDQRKKAGKAAPKLENIIRQLTGDLFLNYVVVNNASFDITTLRRGNPSSFTSSGNNFEMQGLQIDNDSKRPIRVKRFSMAIRNYENFLRDSAYVMKFDSIQVIDDQVSLNRFYFQHTENGRVTKSFTVPRFQLTGLSWDDLLFENKLTAQHAVLYNPIINYTQNVKQKKKRSFYEVLSSINEVMTLDDLDIVRGNIHAKLTDDINVQLENATISLESRSLLGSEQLSGVRRSVTHLDFTKGFFKINDFTILLDGINYTGPDSRMHANKALVFNDRRDVDATINDVFLDEIYINEKNGDVTISGIFWEKAEVKLGLLPSGSKKKAGSVLHLSNIIGNDTRISSRGAQQITAYLKNITASEILQRPGETLVIRGLALNGNDFYLKTKNNVLKIKEFDFSDGEKGIFEQVHYINTGGENRIDIAIPQVRVTPDLASILGQDIIADNVFLNNPIIQFHLVQKKNKEPGLGLPVIRSNNISISNPKIHFSSTNEKGTTKLDWEGQAGPENSVLLKDFKADKTSVSIAQADLSLANFFFTAANGKLFNSTRQGKINAVFNNIHIRQQEFEPAELKANLSFLKGKNFELDSLGKRLGNLQISNIQLRDLFIRSGSSIRQMLKDNQQFRLQEITGGYKDSIKTFTWRNAEYDKRTRMFSMDSFSYIPTPSRDHFIARFPYQVDYMNARTGKITIGPFDLDRYLQDSLIRLGTVRIDGIDFSDFRDKRPPFRSGIIKPTLTNRIGNLPINLSIDSVLLSNATANYTELNPKNNKTGTFPITRINARIININNHNPGSTDSLRIRATGWLMDSIRIQLAVGESYTDSLSGFLMSLRMIPADMRVLNPVLIPLANVKMKSGKLDTLSMRVAGTDYWAFGEMDMRFHDLKLQLLQDDTTRKGLVTALKNFFVGLVIRNKNTRKTGTVFYIRNRERSSLNYLVQLAMSGISSSIGAKNNKKLMRKYKKEIQQRNLPAFEYD